MEREAAAAMTTFQSLDQIVRERAEIQGDRLAYTFLRDGESEDRTTTYRNLDNESRALAGMLQEYGVTRPILVYLPGIDFIVSFFACLYAGITPIPAGLPHISRVGRSLIRLGSIARDAGADAVLSTTRIIDRALGSPEFVSQAPELAAMRWLCTETPDKDFSASWCSTAPSQDTPAFIQYTSGSTSTPKGVVVTHGNLLHNLETCNAIGLNDGDSVGVSWLPHSHDMGLIEGILLPAFAGYPAYLMAPAAFLSRPGRWLQAISRFRGTNSGGPNFAYDLCVDKIPADDVHNLDLSSWRVAYNGSEAIRSDTLLRFRDKFHPAGFQWQSFCPVYGLAESTLLVSTARRTEPPEFCEVNAEALAEGMVREKRGPECKTVTFVACGEAAFHTRIVIVDPHTLTPCTPDEVGEIWVSGPSVARGYWRRPEETEAIFGACLADPALLSRDRFLRTGDLGFFRHGRLFVTGRIKDVINIRGLKHYPQDIELTMAQSHEAICGSGCAAFGVFHDGVEQLALIAEVQPRCEKRNAAMESWQDHVILSIQRSVADRHGISAQAVALVPFGTIPKTTSGKLERYRCRKSFIDGSLPVMKVWSSVP
jgi:acyl-CoA synthetase (AMP-forming)/AMP-acid ligase II